MPEENQGEMVSGQMPVETPTEQAEQPSTPVKSGLESNMAGALSYVLGPITGIYFWVTEKEDNFVRFHAMQSILFSVACVIIATILGFLPYLGWGFAQLINLGILIIWIFLMYQAYNNKEWELPVIGQMARDQINKPK
ncbi:DUF4870 domain-containing protein [Patescibacteria group bacterium]|nr:DUF4870 domain-containing protein [Patescibacteria group bacterium]MBU1867931.1 DUF4870 domain-containing protein [Patescibacteria group bacterium]